MKTYMLYTFATIRMRRREKQRWSQTPQRARGGALLVIENQVQKVVREERDSKREIWSKKQKELAWKEDGRRRRRWEAFYWIFVISTKIGCWLIFIFIYRKVKLDVAKQICFKNYFSKNFKRKKIWWSRVRLMFPTILFKQ